MSTKTILALAAAGMIAAVASPSLAGLNGTVVPLACVLGSKEFAGPVEVKNTSGKLILKGTKITIIAYTAYGKESETIVLTKDLAAGGLVRGSNTYQNVSGGCTASVYYPKIVLQPKRA
jgi:hypothetical protein